jgi:hypothetical protein
MRSDWLSRRSWLLHLCGHDSGRRDRSVVVGVLRHAAGYPPQPLQHSAHVRARATPAAPRAAAAALVAWRQKLAGARKGCMHAGMQACRLRLPTAGTGQPALGRPVRACIAGAQHENCCCAAAVRA